MRHDFGYRMLGIGRLERRNLRLEAGQRRLRRKIGMRATENRSMVHVVEM